VRIRCGLVILVLCGADALRAATYNVTDLGALGGSLSDAYGINASGQVVGRAALTGNSAYAPALFSSSGNKDLGNFGGAFNQANAINSDGAIVGSSALTGNASAHAFVAVGNLLIDLKTLGGANSHAFGINDSGQICGDADTGAATHAFRYEDGVMNDLGPLGGSGSTYGYAINAAGHVVGRALNGTIRAFLATNTVVSLGTLNNGNESTAYGINDSDQIVGTSNIANSGTVFHAFLYQNGVMGDIGVLPGGSIATAYAINNSSQIVGESNITSGGALYHAFLYESGHMTDLNNLIPENSGWVLNTARAINAKGQIAGSGTLNGQTRAFLLTKPNSGSSTQPPRIYINGGRRIVTTKSKLRVEGSSGGDVSRILYRINGKGAWRKTRGDVSGWKATVALKSARTIFQAEAVGPTGIKSKPAKLVIIRTGI